MNTPPSPQRNVDGAHMGPAFGADGKFDFMILQKTTNNRSHFPLWPFLVVMFFLPLSTSLVPNATSEWDHHLVSSAVSDNVTGIKEALAKDANPDTVDATTGFTALMFAAGLGNAEIVKLLIAAKANLNLQGRDDKTALYLAIDNRKLVTAKLLLDAGADPDIRGDFGSTPLQNACRKDDTESVKLLLRAKANAEIADKNDYTPLMMAAQTNARECVKLLLAAKVNANFRSRFNTSALGIAVDKNHNEIIQLLRAAGAKESAPSAAASAPVTPAAPRRKKTDNEYFESFMQKCTSQYGRDKEEKCEKLGQCILSEAQRIPAPYCQTITDCSNLMTRHTRQTVGDCRQRTNLPVGNRVGDTQSAAELLVSQSLAPKIEAHMKSWGSGAGGCTWRKDTQSYWCK